MFSGAHMGLCSPSVSHSPALPQFSPLPDPADSWVLLALAGHLWDLNVPSSHYRKLDSFLDIHIPSINCHIGIYQKIQGLESWWKVIIRQPSTAAWNKLRSWAGASVWGQTRGVALSHRCSQISEDRNCLNPLKIQKGKGKGKWGWGAIPTEQTREWFLCILIFLNCVTGGDKYSCQVRLLRDFITEGKERKSIYRGVLS